MQAAYTEDGIWGIGETDEQAVTDALSYMGRLIEEDEQTVRDSLKTGPMSDRLTTRVLAKGFDCKTDSYVMIEGILSTMEELP